MIAVYVILGIIAIMLIMSLVTYNRLVRMRNQAKNAWAQVDVQLKRRYDLIPNLTETVRGYMGHERSTMEAVTQARNLAQKAAGASVGERSRVESDLTNAVSRLLAVAENYPDLKANQNFLALQQELAVTENNISSARQNYNDAVLRCNNMYQSFPTNIGASIFGFKSHEFFGVEPPEREAPRADFEG
jgi:LemA protein